MGTSEDRGAGAIQHPAKPLPTDTGARRTQVRPSIFRDDAAIATDAVLEPPSPLRSASSERAGAAPPARSLGCPRPKAADFVFAHPLSTGADEHGAPLLDQSLAHFDVARGLDRLQHVGPAPGFDMEAVRTGP